MTENTSNERNIPFQGPLPIKFFLRFKPTVNDMDFKNHGRIKEIEKRKQNLQLHK